MAHLSISLLGRFEVSVDQQIITAFRSDKVRLLLAYLVVESERSHRRQSLAGLFWPGYAERSARRSLSSALANLRAVLQGVGADPPLLLTTRETVRCNLAGDLFLDVAFLDSLVTDRLEAMEITTLVQAVDLYQGEFLQGYSLADCPALEEWLSLQREHYRQRALRALHHLADRGLHSRDYRHAEGYARRSLALDPLDEFAYRQLLRALALGGQRTAALSRYEALRGILAEQLGVGPEAETTALYDAIRTGSFPGQMPPAPPGQPMKPTAVPPRAATGPPSPSPWELRALHQLPPPPGDFTGREAELQDLMDAVHRGTSILALRGLGGVGKTALALMLARQLAERWPDAHFYIEMRGTDPQPMAPSEAMAHVIRSYYPLTDLPQGEVDLRTFYRSVLWGQRALILLDNVRDRAQVEALLPPESCLLLITSRWRFALPGLYALHLDALPAPQAAQLLRAITPWLGAGEASTLALACGCLPLALRVAGSTLAERENLSVKDYVCQLGEQSRRLPHALETVEASLAMSDALLPETLRQRWYALSVFSGTFERAAAAALWDLPAAPEAQEALSELLRHSLLDYDRESGRYRLYDLCRVYAAAHLGEEATQKARARHAQHYAGVVQEANRRFLCGGAEMAEGLALFDRDRANIEAGQAWSAGNEPAARSCMAYCNTEYGFLQLRLHPRQRIAWCEAGLRAAGATSDRLAEMVCLTGLGIEYALSGELDRSLHYCQRALEIARQLGDRRGEGLILGAMGKACENVGQLSRAIAHYQQWLEISQQTGDRRRERIALNGLGTTYFALGEYHHAIAYQKQSLAIALDIGERRGETIALVCLGQAYAASGEARSAIAWEERGLAAARAIGYRSEEAYTLTALGLAHITLGEPHQAVAWLQQGLAVARDSGLGREERHALGALGDAHAALGDIDHAITYYEQAVQVARDMLDHTGEAHALWALSTALDRMGQRTRAMRLAEQALTLYARTGHHYADRLRRQLAAWRGASHIPANEQSS